MNAPVKDYEDAENGPHKYKSDDGSFLPTGVIWISSEVNQAWGALVSAACLT